MRLHIPDRASRPAERLVPLLETATEKQKKNLNNKVFANVGMNKRRANKHTFKPVRALPFRKIPFGHSGARSMEASASDSAL